MSAIEAETHAWMDQLYDAIDRRVLDDRRTLDKHWPTVVGGEQVYCSVCTDGGDAVHYPCPEVLTIARSHGLDGGA